LPWENPPNGVLIQVGTWPIGCHQEFRCGTRSIGAINCSCWGSRRSCWQAYCPSKWII
jgi:hypothetical protein